MLEYALLILTFPGARLAQTIASNGACPFTIKLPRRKSCLNTLSTADENNLKMVGRVIQKMTDLRAKLMTLEVENLVKMKEVLTHEQELALKHQLLRKPERRGSKQPNSPRGR